MHCSVTGSRTPTEQIFSGIIGSDACVAFELSLRTVGLCNKDLFFGNFTARRRRWRRALGSVVEAEGSQLRRRRRTLFQAQAPRGHFELLWLGTGRSDTFADALWRGWMVEKLGFFRASVGDTRGLDLEALAFTCKLGGVLLNLNASARFHLVSSRAALSHVVLDSLLAFGPDRNSSIRALRNLLDDFLTCSFNVAGVLESRSAFGWNGNLFDARTIEIHNVLGRTEFICWAFVNLLATGTKSLESVRTVAWNLRHDLGACLTVSVEGESRGASRWVLANGNTF
jgi:hypothetical protein